MPDLAKYMDLSEEQKSILNAIETLTEPRARRLVEFGLLIDEYRGRTRLIKPNFRSYQIQFIKNHELETRLVH